MGRTVVFHEFEGDGATELFGGDVVQSDSELGVGVELLQMEMLMAWHPESGDATGDRQRFCDLDKGMPPCPELGANAGNDRRPSSLELGKGNVGKGEVGTRFLNFGDGDELVLATELFLLCFPLRGESGRRAGRGVGRFLIRDPLIIGLGRLGLSVGGGLTLSATACAAANSP